MSSDQAMDLLRHFLDNFRASAIPIRGQPPAKFGHIKISPNRLPDRSFISTVINEFPADRKVTRFFVIGGDEPLRLHAGGLAPVEMTFAEFLQVLRENIRAIEDYVFWQLSMAPDTWHEDKVLPENAVVLLQLDAHVSAECALALTLAVHWAVYHSTYPGAKVRLLTLSTGHGHNFLSQLLKIMNSELPVSKLDMSGAWGTNPMASNAVSSATTAGSIAQELAKVVRQSDGTSRLILSFDDSLEKRLGDLLTDDEDTHLDVFTTTYGDPQDLEQIDSKSKAGRTVLCTVLGQSRVRPTTIQSYDQVHLVLGHTDKTTPAYDHTTHQILVYPHRTAQQDRSSQLWWAYHREQSVTVYSCRDTPATFVDQGGESVLLVEGAHLGALITSSIALQRYCIASDKVISCFVRYPLIVEDMIDIMTTQGLLSRRSLALADNETKVFLGVLPLVGYDYHLAMLLALDSLPTVRRTKAQFAAVLMSGSFCKVVNSGNMRGRNVQKVFESCLGCGRSLAMQGSTWLSLGLAKYFLNQLTQRRQTTGAVDGIINFSASGTVCMERLTKKILRIYTSVEAQVSFTDMSSEQEDLTEYEKWQFHSQLFRAYLPRVTVCHYPDNREDNLVFLLYRSMTPCDFNHRGHMPITLIDLDSLIEKFGNDMVFGISHYMKRSSSVVELQDWVMIPAEVICHWLRQHGNISLDMAAMSKVLLNRSNSIEVPEEE
ncbi:hypothetical protein ACHAPO_007270 [Fusarium lateritium]